MLEDFIIELDKPTKAIKILVHLIQELMYEDCNFEECKNPKLKLRYLSSLIYAIGLVNCDISKIRREYYKSVLEGYKKREN
ncbi:MAG: hypothetical protein IKL52_00325 [Candidatus Gastranaerophilales bacterium]|nr:hypothetical protein [Candidatus Gastranaerophilales bacterium]